MNIGNLSIEAFAFTVAFKSHFSLTIPALAYTERYENISFREEKNSYVV
jgi:hypothetical protein